MNERALPIPRYHLQTLEPGDIMAFVGKCLLAILATKVVVIVVMLMAGVTDNGPPSTAAPSISPHQWFDHLVVAPIWETMVFQCLTVELLRRKGMSRDVQFFAAALPFALLHYLGGFVAFMMALTSGVWFAHCYLELRERSRATAVCATILLHSLSNLVFPWIAQIGRTLFP